MPERKLAQKAGNTGSKQCSEIYLYRCEKSCGQVSETYSANALMLRNVLPTVSSLFLSQEKLTRKVFGAGQCAITSLSMLSDAAGEPKINDARRFGIQEPLKLCSVKVVGVGDLKI